MLRRWVVPVSVVLALSGCASLSDRQVADDRPRDGLTCADLDAHAIDADHRASRSKAEAALMSKLQNVRGDMVTAGFRQMRYELHQTRCEIIAGPVGGVHCKAIGSACGRPLKRS